MQRWVQKRGKRIAILFEGRDAAGKGGAIRRFIEHLNPRAMRVVALPKPNEVERGQWYFQRYARQLPNAGEIVFMDRSWYNRAVVEPVNDFCTKEQHIRFMQQVPEYEHMLHEDGVTIIKFWFSISKSEQLSRFKSRRVNPLKQWKVSPVDDGLRNCGIPTRGTRRRCSVAPTLRSVRGLSCARMRRRRRAWRASLRAQSDAYTDKPQTGCGAPDPDIVSRFHRGAPNLD